MLPDFRSQNDFIQNPADHCVSSKQTENEKIILVIWGNDFIITASDNETLIINVKKCQKKNLK